MPGNSLTREPGAARWPVAIVGLACRLPGAPDPGALWRLLRGGGSAIGPVPAARWQIGRAHV